MSSITPILAANNTMPYFMPPTPVLTTFDLGHWMTAAASVDGQEAVVSTDISSFAIVEPPDVIIGVGELGASYPQDPAYEYRNIPWSRRILILSPDVLVMVRTSMNMRPPLREVIKHWLGYHGIYVSYDPSSNDMLVNNKKFLGVQAYENPVGWRTEFAMMTMHKDPALFAVLPPIFQTNARGYELTGLHDEIPIDLVLTLPSLYQAERGEI